MDVPKPFYIRFWHGPCESWDYCSDQEPMKVCERSWYWAASFSFRHLCKAGNHLSVSLFWKSVLHLTALEIAPHSYKETSHRLFWQPGKSVGKLLSSHTVVQIKSNLITVQNTLLSVWSPWDQVQTNSITPLLNRLFLVSVASRKNKRALHDTKRCENSSNKNKTIVAVMCAKCHFIMNLKMRQLPK